MRSCFLGKIFIKNNCIAGLRNYFLGIILTKKNQQIGLFYIYKWYYIFAKHKPIVNMAGNPDKIKDEEDKKESESRINDPLLVKYFSLYMMKESGKLINSMIDYSKKAKYPLLLIYGSKDNIVDKKGCDLIFKNWNHPKKQYFVIQNGAHGKSSVLLAKDIINKWIKEE